MPESAKSEQSRAAYLMLYTSQSGKVRPLTTRLIVDSAWLAVWSKEAMHENSKIEAGKSILELNTIWDRDRTAAVLFNAK